MRLGDEMYFQADMELETQSLARPEEETYQEKYVLSPLAYSPSRGAAATCCRSQSQRAFRALIVVTCFPTAFATFANESLWSLARHR